MKKLDHKKILRIGFAVASLGVFGAFALVVGLLLWIPLLFYIGGSVQPAMDERAHKDLGKDMVGKYYVVTREAFPPIEKSFDQRYYLPAKEDQYEARKLEWNDVLLFQSAEYDSRFAKRTMRFEVSFPCEDSQVYPFSVNGENFKDGRTFIHSRLEEITPEQVDDFCAKSN